MESSADRNNRRQQELPNAKYLHLDSKNLESILECSICMSIICEPITISCGHSFCRVCLVKSLKRHKKKCPSCRAVCHIQAENAEESIMLKNLCLSLFPNIYRDRLAELEEEKKVWSTTLPIFYYNTCQYPGSYLELNFFEPRYKLMMQRIVNSNRKFAYVPNFTNYSASPGDVALIADLSETQFAHDGSVQIKARLTERKIITEHFGKFVII